VACKKEGGHYEIVNVERCFPAFSEYGIRFADSTICFVAEADLYVTKERINYAKQNWHEYTDDSEASKDLLEVLDEKEEPYCAKEPSPETQDEESNAISENGEDTDTELDEENAEAPMVKSEDRPVGKLVQHQDGSYGLRSGFSDSWDTHVSEYLKERETKWKPELGRLNENQEEQ